MHRDYFPRCEVDGPIEPPVPFSYGWGGAIPKKCADCDLMFEGECRRGANLGRYLKLDYGPCGIAGPTDPVYYEDQFVQAKVQVPRKCVKCVFLECDRIRGFFCGKDHDKWGDRGRSLDWGQWEPDSVYVELPAPKKTSLRLVECARMDDRRGFVEEYRRINPNESVVTAQTDFEFVCRCLTSE